MCGISGFNWEDTALGDKMNECLVHRGPDASGIFTDSGVTLAHRRLSIIDLSEAANQPMTDASNELVLVYNGEIYNYLELKEELKDEYKFKTSSDSEVILAGYRKWGRNVVGHLNGIFALAIWNKKDKTLFCARDHMGVKPFYYSWDGGRFIFASEVSAILSHGIERKLNISSFNQYMRVLYSPEPNTLIEGIKKLSPGCSIMLKDSELFLESYYVPEFKKKELNYEEAKKKVKQTVSNSIQRQLVSDVPVGIYLSGGIDSSIVLAAASKVRENINTFSIGFDLEEEEEREKFNSDFELAKETARHFGATHHPIVISAKDVARDLEKIIGSFDDPISNPTALPMYFLAKFTKGKATVVLSGEGGDELFGGYERYRMSDRVDKIGKIPLVKYFLPARIRKALEMSSLDRLVQFEFEKDKRLSSVISESYLERIDSVKKEFSKYIIPGDKTEALMMADIRSWLPDQALLLGDKMTMKGSLEGRVPFLDREVVDLALGLPKSYKVDLFNTKKILKDAFRDELPAILLNQPKRGWFSPGAKWLRRPEVKEVVKIILSPDYHAPTAKLFDWEGIRQMLENHIEKREYNLTILWAILTFQIWAKRYNIVL
jgi:asparagine synthase (glutamine-hydrolysing)